jgi:hypothetical protein
MYDRWFARGLGGAMSRPYVHLLFGARPTGESTLLRALIPAADVWIDLSNPGGDAHGSPRLRRLTRRCSAGPP